MKKKQNMKDTLYTAACGAWIGGTMTVPGVSGGSMAMILGIYDRLITSVNGIFKKDKFKESLIFLLKFMIGAVIGPGGKVIQEMQKQTNTVIATMPAITRARGRRRAIA